MHDNIKTVIYNLEISLLHPEVRSSVKKLDFLLADDFKEFGSSGKIYDKKQILERLPEEHGTGAINFSVSDFEVRELTDNYIFVLIKSVKFFLIKLKPLLYDHLYGQKKQEIGR